MGKTYSLYSNKEQDELYACAHSVKELKEVSLEYLNGVWFEYDIEKKEGFFDRLLNERFYKGKTKFAKELKIKEKSVEELENEKFMLRDSIGDIR